MLTITNLHASIGQNEILKGLNLTILPGEVHAVMGPNGSGKSTLSKAITGHPDCRITAGDIVYGGQSLLPVTPEERSMLGVFLSFQYPVEIPGVNNASFLRSAYNLRRERQGLEELDPLEFNDFLEAKLQLLSMDESFLDRAVNHGFSGGEKKRNEILQMAILEPKLAILDEVDSGLDIDALRIVAEAINKLKKPDNAFLLITHYQRLLSYIVPDYVHVIAGGQIIKSGDKSFALELEEKGYDWLL